MKEFLSDPSRVFNAISIFLVGVIVGLFLNC
jgi:chloramphenicol 3-O-phosphotransferase